MIEHFGTVSSEGGPFLVADARRLRDWTGVDGHDYDQLCLELNSEVGKRSRDFGVLGGRFVAWDPGIGTADIVSNGEAIMLVHPSDSAIEGMQLRRSAAIHLEIKCGVLAVLWAPENGNCILDNDLNIKTARAPSGRLAIDGSSLLVPLPVGLYSLQSEVGSVDGIDVRTLSMQAIAP